MEKPKPVAPPYVVDEDGLRRLHFAPDRVHSTMNLADPYALVFYGWGVRAGLDMKALTAYTAWKDRMLQRPAVRKILESEQNVLVKPAA